MNKIGYILLLLLLPTSLLCQTRFTEGYVIDNRGKRIDCFLMNKKIENKGEHYNIKLVGQENHERIDIRLYKEFGIPGKVKFVREKIRIDVSDDHILDIKDTLDHTLIQEGDAYLQELIASNHAALYYFFHQGKEYFFFKVGGSGTTHLVYKKYRLVLPFGETSRVLMDNRYRLQLDEYLPCSQDVSTLLYTRNSLIKYFKIYHKENNIPTNLENTYEKGIFSARINASFNQFMFVVDDGEQILMDFEKSPSLGFGMDLEYMFAFNRNKFGAFTGCNYYSFNSTSDPNYSPYISEITYRAIDLPIGIVYKFNLSEYSKISLRGGLTQNFILDNSSFSLYRPENPSRIRNTRTFMLAAGYSYGPVSLEARVYSKRNMLSVRISDFEQYSMKLALRFLDF